MSVCAANVRSATSSVFYNSGRLKPSMGVAAAAGSFAVVTSTAIGAVWIDDLSGNPAITCLATLLAGAAAAACVGLWTRRGLADRLAALARTIDDLNWERAHNASDPTKNHDEISRLEDSVRRLATAVSRQSADAQAAQADLAHEIRNPLCSLRTAAEALRNAEPARRDMLLAVIDADVGRLDRLVGEVFAFEQFKADLHEENATEFNLAVTISEVVAHQSRIPRSNGVELVLDMPTDPMLIFGSEARIAQVLVNLIDNALSFSEPGDAVRIWARRRSDDVLLAVEDTGPGIPTGAAETIFRRRYSSRQTEEHGTLRGLGLSIARRIVEAHRGAIWAENIRPTDSDLLSEPLGARFAVLLPSVKRS